MDYNLSSVYDIRSKKSSVLNNRPTEQGADSDLNHGIFLCILYKNGKLGAAYYNFQDKTLNVFEEMSDRAPQFLVSASVYRELIPKYLLTFGNFADEYVKALREFVTFETENTTTSNSLRVPDNIFLVSPKDFAYENCKTIVLNINLASKQLDEVDNRQELYIHSLVNFNHRLSVQALAALYKYLEKHSSQFGIETDGTQFLYLNQVSMKNHVLIDTFSFKSMQIFCTRSHEAGFKRGQEASSREGLSIYKLFLSFCKSAIGQVYLRSLLLTPINDQSLLRRRLDFIEFVQEPVNFELVQNIQDNVKKLRDISVVSSILGKIQNSRATNRDWQTLYEVIFHTISIYNLIRHCKEKSELLSDLSNSVTVNLLALQESISNALDFSTGLKRGRPVIKFGLDENLDAKLLRQQDIAKHVTAAARFAVNDLPNFINECKVVYLPEMGHLMAIKEWEPDCDPETLSYLGYQFMFLLGGTIHYKNPLCLELDKRLGDINAEIIDHENRILRRLSAFTLKYNKDIREPLKIFALMDCLIAMAKVSQQNNFVKPTLNSENVHEIVKCRHPLMEKVLTSFKANSFRSGGVHSNMKIITGANGSGKSIYLKQIAVVIYLAHIGCYVPAKSANIGLIDSMHCRMHATESAVVRLSSLMIDIAQTSQALHHASPSSLIIMDEFGRGTLDDDGLALLIGFLKSLSSKGDDCPHVLVSTHLQRIKTFLPETPKLEYMKMGYTMENGTFCFLHSLTKGISGSCAFEIAETTLSKDVIQKGKTYFEYLKMNAEQAEL